MWSLQMTTNGWVAAIAIAAALTLIGVLRNRRHSGVRGLGLSGSPSERDAPSDVRRRTIRALTIRNRDA